MVEEEGQEGDTEQLCGNLIWLRPQAEGARRVVLCWENISTIAIIGEDEIRLPPAGSLYPLNMVEGNTLALSWEQGVASLIISGSKQRRRAISSYQ